MIKLRLNPIFLFAIILAFISVQWVSSSTHIHLSENHQHDNHDHQHSIQSHSHALAKHHQTSHADSIDSFHAPESSKSVNLDQECSNLHTVYKSANLTLILPDYPLNLKTESVSLYRTIEDFQSPSYLNQSNVNPRAPPIYS